MNKNKRSAERGATPGHAQALMYGSNMKVAALRDPLIASLGDQD